MELTALNLLLELSAPATTAMTRIPSRSAVAARQNFASEVKPVFPPSQPL